MTNPETTITSKQKLAVCVRTLEKVRDAILNAPPEVLTDTLWFSDIETVVDLIDDTLELTR